jgi:hypothetical protein
MTLRTYLLAVSLFLVACGSTPAPSNEDLSSSSADLAGQAGDLAGQSGDLAGPRDMKMGSTTCHTAGCRKFSSYCGSCTCIALIADNPDPDCGGMMVTCAMDPCLGKTATCNHGNGMCVLQ